MASHHLINNITRFEVYQESWLPSDHAPVAIELVCSGVDLDSLHRRACNLGGHGAMATWQVCDQLTRKPINFQTIDHEQFIATISNLNLVFNEDNANIDNTTNQLSKVLYESPVGTAGTHC